MYLYIYIDDIFTYKSRSNGVDATIIRMTNSEINTNKDTKRQTKQQQKTKKKTISHYICSPQTFFSVSLSK